MTTLLETRTARAGPELPSAQRERWQPIRGGLLNLYRYDYEEFRYEQGRLLLRGNNGTGKSRVLALQLPFLLDGDVSAHRLEPDGDPAKRIEWNLLLDRHPDRLGYTWLEFGRREGDDEQYCTLGCGLHAVAGRGLVGKWFFMTTQRIGRDLFLQRPNGTPLTRDRLGEEIGEHGQLFTSAGAYRAAVDRALFGLGEHRYEALVNLLVQLRQPQLSRQLDERRLSAALSEALPPLSEAIVGDVAEAMRALEADRDALDDLLAARAGVEDFLAEYRRYTQILARRRAADVRGLQYEYEATMRRLRAAEVEQQSAATKLAEASREMERLALDETAAERAVQTLAASERMRDAEALDRARSDAGAREREAITAEREHHRTVDARDRRDGDLDDARQRADEIRAAVADVAERARSDAAGAGLDRQHAEAGATLALPDGPDDGREIDRAQHAVLHAADHRRRAARHLEGLQGEVDSAMGELRLAKHEQERLGSELDEATEAHQSAHRGVGSAAEGLATAYRAWVRQLRELVSPDPDGVVWELEHWAGTGEGVSPIVAAVRQAERVAGERLAAFRSDARGRLEDAETELAAMRAEQDRLRSGAHVPPPAPHTRTSDVRATRAGAPLWLLCDFAEGVDDVARAGIEAALEAAGLLDAWVTPDGRLLDAAEHDTVLIAGTSPAPASSLAGLLIPAVDRADPQTAAVSDRVVMAVLRHIGFGSGAGPMWVAADGRWQAGPAHGTWSKPTAEHLGEGAREAARRRRLDELVTAAMQAEQQRDDIARELSALDERLRVAAQEAADAPDDSPVRGALAARDAAGRAVRGLRRRLSASEERVATRRGILDEVTSRRDAAAEDLGLTSWVNDLPGLLDAIAAYERSVAELWPTLRAHLQARRHADQARARAEEAADAEHRQQELAVLAQQRAAAAAMERQTLEATVGAAVEEVLAELAAARARVQVLRTDREAAREAQSQARTAVAVAEHDIAERTEALSADDGRRQVAVEALADYSTTGLLEVAHVELAGIDAEGWSVDRAVRIARRIEQLLDQVDSDDLAWKRTQGSIHRHLQTLVDSLLPHGYDPTATLVDQVLVVTVPFHGRNCSMTQLRDALAEEVASRQSLLDAREREVLENHLIGEVSAHLHDLLRAGEQWVAEVNEELASVPMSTGMALRFVWRPLPDGPNGLPEARARLLRAGGTWSQAEREALGAFLQAQIRAVRAADDTGTWQEHLASALDYRAWHSFEVERRQDGVWKRLTRRTHGTGSGGEKAIALTLPQFAAAGAHYRSAGPHAPRLILLDEAFVGVDADMRSKCMGLLHAFDLDFVMTSEREWACYPTLPGVSIYQLATRPGIDAVGLTRWVWNGRERVRVVDELPPARPAS